MSLNTFSGSNITYTHNLGNKYIVTDLYDTGGLQITPNSLTASANNVQFDFTFPTEGWVVVKGAEYSQSFTSATSVNVSHSLGTDNIILNVFDTNDVLITPDTISLSGSNNAIVDFTFGTSGYVTVVQDDYTQSFSSVTQSAITHGLGTKNILVSVYDNNDDEVVPDGIDLINDNTASITFTSNTSGKAVVVNGYTSSYVIPSASIYIGNDTISVTGSTCIPITVGNGFTNIYSWTSRIAYDASLLNFVGESNDFLGVTLFNPTPGQISFIWTAANASGSTFVSGSSLFSICFEAVATGSASLYFTGSPTTPPEILSSSLQEIPGDYYSGSVIIQALPPTPPPPPPASLSGSFDYLVVGGGGAGGPGFNRNVLANFSATARGTGGGGGAGGFVTGSFSGSLGLSFDITVGNGGYYDMSIAPSTSFALNSYGEESKIDSILLEVSASGGGKGGYRQFGRLPINIDWNGISASIVTNTYYSPASPFNPSTIFYDNPSQKSVVGFIVSGNILQSAYYANNPSKNGTNTWDNPFSGPTTDWAKYEGFGEVGGNGGSGGGSTHLSVSGSGIDEQGNDGGVGSEAVFLSSIRTGAGGGGAGSNGIGVIDFSSLPYDFPLFISGCTVNYYCGNPQGGSGSQWIDGNWYAGGGAGGTIDITACSTASYAYQPISGGIGGGGTSGYGTLDGIPNTGGGGAGAINILTGSNIFCSGTGSVTESFNNGGTGGSGIVKFRYPVSEGLIFDKGETIVSGGYYFTTFTASVNDVTLVTATGSTTLYLYQTSSEAEYFDILWGSSETGPWTIVPSGSNVPLGSLYSYTVNLPSNATYLKLMNKNPLYFPDNFRIHPVTFGEPAKGVVPTGSIVPPNLIQSMSADIIVYNGTTSSIDVTNVYMSASIYQQNAFMAPTVSIAPDSSSAFVIQSLGISANPIEFPDQIEVVIEVNGNILTSITGSWIDINTSDDIYDGYYSGSYFTGGKTYSKFIFDTKTTFTTESQVYISGQSTL